VSELSLDPSDWLPHRPPFLLLDVMLSIEPGHRASGLWTLTGDEWFFPGHFPGRPTTPGVLLLESIAQCGAVVVLAEPKYAGRLPLFGGVEHARFRRQVLPGDVVLVECEMTPGIRILPSGSLTVFHTFHSCSWRGLAASNE